MKTIILITLLIALNITIAKDNNGLIGAVEKLNKIQFDCSEGFVNIHNGKNGKIGKSIGCMQKKDNEEMNWHESNKTCFQKYNARLPSASEWFISAEYFNLENETDNFEHTNDIHRYGGNTTAILVGKSSIYSTAGVNINKNDKHHFRCFIPR